MPLTTAAEPKVSRRLGPYGTPPYERPARGLCGVPPSPVATSPPTGRSAAATARLAQASGRPGREGSPLRVGAGSAALHLNLWFQTSAGESSDPRKERLHFANKRLSPCCDTAAIVAMVPCKKKGAKLQMCACL